MDRLLTNNDVSFEISFEIDSFQKSVHVWSKYRNAKTKEQGEFPGVMFIDDELIRLEKHGNIILPIYPREPYQVGGSHKLSLRFSDDMNKVDMTDGGLESETQDSVSVHFDVSLFGLDVAETANRNFLSFKPNKPVPDQEVPVIVFGGDSNGVFQRCWQGESFLKENRLMIAKTLFSNPSLTNYTFQFVFLSEKEIIYRGKRKGYFRLYYTPNQPFYKTTGEGRHHS